MIRVLFVCTANAARSQMAEALLAHLGAGRFEVASRAAVEVLRAHGIAWDGRFPKPVEDFEHDAWDVVITVCDHAREYCPVFPSAPVVAHWGMPDPAAVQDPDARRDAFHETYRVLHARIERLAALPLEGLDVEERRREVEAIGRTA